VLRTVDHAARCARRVFIALQRGSVHSERFGVPRARVHDIVPCKAALLAIADDDAGAIANDRGVIMRGTEYASLVRENPDWDWRSDRVRVDR
jgi:hypothetical protein